MGRARLPPVALIALALLGACGSRSAPPAVVLSNATTEAPAAAADNHCEAANTIAAFRACPHWRLANEQACGNGPGPAAYDPCRCMCDLCETDTDCGSDERCMPISSVMAGGFEQSACVRRGSPCYPDSTVSCPPSETCRNYDGHPRCARVQMELD